MRLVSSIKAAVALAAGFIITFAQNHSALAGLWVLSGYAVVTAVGILIAAFKSSIAEAIILLMFGSFAYLLTQTAIQLELFIWLVASLSLSLTVVSLYQAAQLGLKTKKAKDPIITAALNALLGALFLLAPLDEVAAVGFFGAYLILIAVHLGISAASPVAPAKPK